jgi:hypothetical protein
LLNVLAAEERRESVFNGWRRTVMHYLSFFTAINPYVLAVLAAVLACGAVDWLIRPH